MRHAGRCEWQVCEWQVWHLLLTYGVLLGLGHSLSLFAGVVLLNKVFKKRRALASGIGSSGNGVGALVFGATLPPLISSIGVWAALRVLSGVTLFLTVVAASFMTVPGGHGGIITRVGDLWRYATTRRNIAQGPSEDKAERPKAPEPPRPVPWSEVLSNGKVVAAYCAVGIAAFGLWVPTVYLVQYAVDRGYEGQEATLLVSFIGIGGLTLRIPTTVCADTYGQRLVTSILLYIFSLLGICARWLSQSYPGLVVMAIASGWLVGSFMSLLGPMMAEIVEPRLMARSTTLAFTLLGIGFMSGPPIAGEIYEAAGDLDIAFLVAGLQALAGAIILTTSIYGQDMFHRLLPCMCGDIPLPLHAAKLPAHDSVEGAADAPKDSALGHNMPAPEEGGVLPVLPGRMYPPVGIYGGVPQPGMMVAYPHGSMPMAQHGVMPWSVLPPRYPDQGWAPAGSGSRKEPQH
mmetsp:Transcript_14817/g.34462  ORF Transcript_14817/g.34462 Transcript_14817/m.34462 type:complete len:460 (-) Transcript_14817:103-1482(-)